MTDIKTVILHGPVNGGRAGTLVRIPAMDADAAINRGFATEVLDGRSTGSRTTVEPDSTVNDGSDSNDNDDDDTSSSTTTIFTPPSPPE